ncbi:MULTISPECIES: ATP-binding protein [Streptomyces]|uniref:ATP-binding protein n=1 Tax=Streptomyces TaxID=1883 RepID=UPI001FE51B06|nr:ATP-binding protein [Streptomyces aidingensis]
MEQQLHEWGIPYDSETSQAAVTIVAELAANAVTHGFVPGRDFRVGILVTSAPRVRIEVSDRRGDRLPLLPPCAAGSDCESGRGLKLVTALADCWGVLRWAGPVPGKTVWAEVSRREPEPDGRAVAEAPGTGRTPPAGNGERGR